MSLFSKHPDLFLVYLFSWSNEYKRTDCWYWPTPMLEHKRWGSLEARTGNWLTGPEAKSTPLGKSLTFSRPQFQLKDRVENTFLEPRGPIGAYVRLQLSEQDLSGPPCELGTGRLRLADWRPPERAPHLVPGFLIPLKTHSNTRKGSALSSSPSIPSEPLGPSTQRDILKLLVGRWLFGWEEVRVISLGCAHQTVLQSIKVLQHTMESLPLKETHNGNEV